jgi:hypothetical protein
MVEAFRRQAGLSSELCGEGKLRTPKCDNQKFRFLMHLASQVTEHNSKSSTGKIQE